jgi:hypothetical protein
MPNVCMGATDCSARDGWVHDGIIKQHCNAGHQMQALDHIVPAAAAAHDTHVWHMEAQHYEECTFAHPVPKPKRDHLNLHSTLMFRVNLPRFLMLASMTARNPQCVAPHNLEPQQHIPRMPPQQ